LSLLDDVQIHLEITSNCNSRCLECARFVKGTDLINPWVTVGAGGNMSLQTLENVFDPEVCRSIRAVNFTGTYGEATAHPKFFEILNFIADRVEAQKAERLSQRRSEKIQIIMETNGGLHSPDWWAQFGDILLSRFHERSQIVFGIDGSNDEVHQMYRRGVPFHRCIENARSLKRLGVRVVWSMIVFEHNEHQVEQAEQMALSEGFRFKRRRSRLRHKNAGHLAVHKTKKAGISQKGADATSSQKNILNKQFSAVDEKQIECEWKGKKQISIDYDGVVWQCCYFSTFNHPGCEVNEKIEPLEHKKKEGLWEIEKRYEINWNSVVYHPLSQIMSHEFFIDDLPRSLNIENGQVIKRCQKHCGKKTRQKEKELTGAS
jgi:MoaA/NifB/PqqE/SkfB family radical SAM enzyme